MEYGTGMPYEDEERLPDFFSMNVSTSLNFNLLGGRMGLYLEIANLTNHENVIWRTTTESTTSGMLPMVGIRGSF